MKADDLDLLRFLSPRDGGLHFNNRRMLLWDADAFGNLRQELIEVAGVDRARPILRRFGFANGYRDALGTRELFGGNDREWWLSCPVLQSKAGKVQATADRLVIDRERGVFEADVVWNGSYEAAQHARAFGEAKAPVCWTLSGFASGFSSAVMGEEVFAIEEQCAAMGADSCRVVGRTRRAWGDRAGALGAEYRASELMTELDAREREVRATVADGSNGEVKASNGNGTSNGNSTLASEVCFRDVIPMADMERAYVLKVLEHFDGNRTHTARALQIGTNTLWRKLKAWGIPPAR